MRRYARRRIAVPWRCGRCAFATNPLSVLVIAFIAVSAVWLAVDIVRGRDSYWKIYGTRWRRPAIVIAIVIILANWAWNIWKEL